MKKTLAALTAFVMVFGAGGVLPDVSGGFGSLIRASADHSDLFDDPEEPPEEEYITYEYGDYVYTILKGGAIQIETYHGSEEDITIPAEIDGSRVTSIMSYAFEENQNLKSLTIPEGLVTIGNYAFQKCPNLAKVTLPASATEIGEAVFADCPSLTSITIPYGNTGLGYFAFLNGTSLTSVTLPDSLDYIGFGSFKGCTALTSITIPESVTSIEGDAFNGCTGLTEVTIPGNVSYIGDGSFTGCSNLKSVTIPNSVNRIKPKAFYDCTSLTSVTIPHSVNFIGDHAFGYSGDNEKIPGFKIYCVKDSVAEKYAVDNGFDYELIEQSTIVDSGKCGENATWTLDDADTLTISGTGRMNDYDFNTPWGYGINKVVIEPGITYIGNFAFSECRNLTEVTIPDTVTEIGNCAFNICTNLTSITIPGSVKTIGRSAFSECVYLKDLIISDGVKNIGESAFETCTRLESVTIPDSVTSIGKNAFFDCTSMKSATLPMGDISIGDYALGYYYYQPWDVGSWYSDSDADGPRVIENFKIYCYKDSSGEEYAVENEIDHVLLPTSGKCGENATWTLDDDGTLTISGTGAMYDYEYDTPWGLGINKVVIEPGITSIGSYAFALCSKLTDVTIPDTVTNIGNGAFISSGLKSAEIPGSVASIGEYAFGYSGENEKIPGFRIYCYDGSAGEKYAAQNEIDNELITKALSECTITIEPESFTYDGTEKKPEVTVKDGEKALAEGTDYTVSYFDNTDVETGKVTITGVGNYSGTKTVEFTISKENEIIKGDANGDGAITVTDISKIAAHVKGIKALSEEEQKHADVNGDGAITVTDISKVAAHVKGIRSIT